MGASASTQNGSGHITHGHLAVSHLLDSIRPGWFSAGDETSKKIIKYPGPVWAKSPRDGAGQHSTFTQLAKQMDQSLRLPSSTSYGGAKIMEKKVQLLAKEYGIKGEPDPVTALEGRVLFYGHNHIGGSHNGSIKQVFNLNDQPEICGLAFLPSPLMYYPIGKNFSELHGQESPYLMFAIPDLVIIRVSVDGSEVGSVKSPAGGRPCFFTWSVKENKDLTIIRKIPVYITARSDNIRRWDSSDYATNCVASFSELIKSLSAGKHEINVSVQFAYRTGKVRVVQPSPLSPTSSWQFDSSSLRNDHIMDISQMEIARNSSLAIRSQNSGKLVTSPCLCSGKFHLLIPDKTEFWRVASVLHGLYDSHDSEDDLWDFQETNFRKEMQAQKKKKKKPLRRRFSSDG